MHMRKHIRCGERLLDLVMGLARTKLLLVGLILVLATFAVIRPISASDGFVSISNSGNIEVIAGQSNHNTITFSISDIAVTVIDVSIICSGLPAGATCSTNPSNLPGPFANGASFEVIVSTLPSTPPGTYPITVEVSFIEFRVSSDVIQPSFLASSGGSLEPESISIQQSTTTHTTFNLIVDPATFPPVHPTPVGGVMLPSVGLSVLLPWTALLSLLGVLSMEAFLVRRRVKRR